MNAFRPMVDRLDSRDVPGGGALSVVSTPIAAVGAVSGDANGAYSGDTGAVSGDATGAYSGDTGAVSGGITVQSLAPTSTLVSPDEWYRMTHPGPYNPMPEYPLYGPGGALRP